MCISIVYSEEKIAWKSFVNPQSWTLPFQRNLFYLLQWKPFKNDEKCSWSHRKNSLRFKSFKSFSWIFRHVARKNGLIRKLRLISKLMTTQHRYQSVTIQILPNISRSKGNETMEFGQLIDYDKRNIFFRRSFKNEARWLVPDLFLFFKKAFYEVKASVLQLSFNIFSPQLGIQ